VFHFAASDEVEGALPEGLGHFVQILVGGFGGGGGVLVTDGTGGDERKGDDVFVAEGALLAAFFGGKGGGALDELNFGAVERAAPFELDGTGPGEGFFTHRKGGAEESRVDTALEGGCSVGGSQFCFEGVVSRYQGV